MEKKLFLLSGKARHGKDTAALFIKEYYESLEIKTFLTSFSKYIKMYAQDISDWDGSEETKSRDLLQRLGTEIIREKLNKELLFINRLKDDVDVYNEFFDVVVIKDVRLPIEIDEMKKKFPKAISIHINRINFETELIGNQLKHRTETALEEYENFDYVVEIDNLEQFKENIVNILKELD